MAEKKDPIRSLIDTGRRAGKLTSSEISDAMEENGNVLDVEAMEKLYEELESNGIEIVDDTPVDVSSALPSSEEGADDYEDGLTADGIVGPKTLSALGLSGSSSGGGNGQWSSSDMELLARMVSAEARGEPYTGQVAVAAVVLNRVESSEFPNSVSGVIYQSGAFDVVADGQINLSPDETAIKAARDAMNGWDPTGGCLFYYNPATSTNQWMLSKPVLLTIGNHSFFK